nr:hypothetical protein CFP56_24127 [Quercus suber]
MHALVDRHAQHASTTGMSSDGRWERIRGWRDRGSVDTTLLQALSHSRRSHHDDSRKKQGAEYAGTVLR